MTTYATPDMVRNALRVPDSAPVDVVRIPVDSLEDDDIQPHIDQSDADASTYCSGQPVSDAFIAAQSTNIAAYLLVLAWRGSADLVTGTDPVYLRYQHTMTMLEDVAKGLLTIEPIPDSPDGISTADLVDVRLTTTNVFGHGVRVDQPAGYPDNSYPFGYGW